MNLHQQIYLGDEAFVERTQKEVRTVDKMTIPRAQHQPPTPEIAEIARHHTHRNEAIVAAHATGTYSYREIAEYFSLHLVTVGGIARASRKRKGAGKDAGRA